MKVLLGFNFYGAGNVGDDLMVAGFLDGFLNIVLSIESITCAIPFNLKSQQIRFPQIDWHKAKFMSRREAITACDLWIGVGDTPFQVISGLWFLKYLKNEVRICEEEKKPLFMIGVGAEQEAKKEKGEFNNIINNTNFIVTRDKASADIIRNDFGNKTNNILISADLANISLQQMFPLHKDVAKVYDLGFTINTDTLSHEDVCMVKKFIDNLSALKKVFICNEIRKGKKFEHSIYRKYFKPWYNQSMTSNIDLFLPNYQKGSIQDLIAVYRRCETIITTRYHGLLTAAWAGCKVGVIARSSKVENLAKILEVPYVKSPVTLPDLQQLYERVRKVSRKKLDFLASEARSGIRYFGEVVLPKYFD